MKEELETTIRRDFRELFSLETGNQIWCQDGWYELIYDTLKKIYNLSKGIAIIQIKEKFGALRIYIKNVDPENENYEKILDIIDLTETKSKTICENCGKPATIMNYHGWLKTVCDECIKKLEQERKR